MNQMIELLANIVTILGFPFSIFLVVKELRNNNKSISKLADSIKQQQIQSSGPMINTDKIENLNMNNYETPKKDLNSNYKNDK